MVLGEELVFELKRDFTIVIVTHNMQQAARVSDVTAFFWLGELVEYAPTKELFFNPRDERTETEGRETGRSCTWSREDSRGPQGCRGGRGSRCGGARPCRRTGSAGPRPVVLLTRDSALERRALVTVAVVTLPREQARAEWLYHGRPMPPS